MVVNTHYRFIFVHIPKAAGTSITSCLSKLKGNNKRWLANTKHETLSEFLQSVNQRKWMIDRLLERDPQNYFHFGFVRNPWDRMSSFYRYLEEKRPRQEIDSVHSFKDLLLQARDGVTWITDLYTMRHQIDFFTMDSDRLQIDFLGHFEHMREDLSSIEQHIGCQFDLRHLNRSTNFGRDYRTDFDSGMIEIVAELFRDDIRQFGYSFEQPDPANRCSGPLNCPR